MKSIFDAVSHIGCRNVHLYYSLHVHVEVEEISHKLYRDLNIYINNSELYFWYNT